MKTKTIPYKKLADWELAFNSINSLQTHKALEGLIDLRIKIGATSPGVA